MGKTTAYSRFLKESFAENASLSKDTEIYPGIPLRRSQYFVCGTMWRSLKNLPFRSTTDVSRDSDPYADKLLRSFGPPSEHPAIPAGFKHGRAIPTYGREMPHLRLTPNRRATIYVGDIRVYPDEGYITHDARALHIPSRDQNDPSCPDFYCVRRSALLFESETPTVSGHFEGNLNLSRSRTVNEVFARRWKVPRSLPQWDAQFSLPLIRQGDSPEEVSYWDVIIHYADSDKRYFAGVHMPEFRVAQLIARLDSPLEEFYEGNLKSIVAARRDLLEPSRHLEEETATPQVEESAVSAPPATPTTPDPSVRKYRYERKSLREMDNNAQFHLVPKNMSLKFHRDWLKWYDPEDNDQRGPEPDPNSFVYVGT